MTDRELLELAARSIGVEGVFDENTGDIWRGTGSISWNSLKYDGDALRLAVVTDQIVTINRVDGLVSVQCGYHGEITVIEYFGDCMFAAVRRAITRAAAQIQLNKEAANE
jgi:hypothetical protein